MASAAPPVAQQPSHPRYPSKREQTKAREVFAPPEFTQSGRVQSISTTKERQTFCAEAEDTLNRWISGKLQNLQGKHLNRGNLAASDLTDIHAIGGKAVTDMYADLLVNAVPTQGVRPRSDFQFVTGTSYPAGGMCQRLFNVLESDGVFRAHNMLHQPGAVKAVKCDELASSCPTTPPTCASDHSSDLTAALNVIGNVLCTRLPDLQKIAALDPGFTDGTNVYIQSEYTAPNSSNPDTNHVAFTRAYAVRRWESLMTIVHENLHTLAHPRFKSAMGDSSKVAFADVGIEGVAEYFARPVKFALQTDALDPKDSSFAESIAGGNSNIHRNSRDHFNVDDKYDTEVGEAKSLVKKLGRRGHHNLAVAYFRGWVEFIGFENDRESRPYSGKKYDVAELDAYLGERADQSLGRGIHADDKARGVVDDWRRGLDPERGTSRFSLTTTQKATLINQMLQGVTGNPDERAILEILQQSTKSEWYEMFGEDGQLDQGRLVGKFQRQRRRLAGVVEAKLGITLREFRDGGLP